MPRRRLELIVARFAACVAVAVSLAGAANAGAQTGQVAKVVLTAGDVGTAADSRVHAVLTSTGTGKPACATNPYWFVRDAKSEIGRQQVALLLTAKATGKAVTIIGTGNCTRWVDGEDILQIEWE